MEAKKDTKSNQIYVALKQDIVQGEYAASFSLTENDLAKRFGASRNTIKKALLMLEADNLIVMEENKGAKVKAFSIEEVIEFLEVREELESFILRNAMRNFSGDQIDELSRLLEEMRKHKQERNLIEYSNCNKQFHNVIYSACSNKTAVDLTFHLKDQMKKYNGKTILAPGRDESSLQEHTQILEAIKNNDEKTAELYIRIHIRNVANTFKEYHSLLF